MSTFIKILLFDQENISLVILAHTYSCQLPGTMAGITDHTQSVLRYVQGRNLKLSYVDMNIYMTATVCYI